MNRDEAMSNVLFCQDEGSSGGNSMHLCVSSGCKTRTVDSVREDLATCVLCTVRPDEVDVESLRTYKSERR